jgi:hypothetical protein
VVFKVEVKEIKKAGFYEDTKFGWLWLINSIHFPYVLFEQITGGKYPISGKL